MARYDTEMFAQCVYSLDLSYHDLLEFEAELKLALNRILEQNNAEFIHFEELGDTMRAQCVFTEYTEGLFHSVCDAVAPLMDNRVEARLLFVSKDLDFLHCYILAQGAWQEGCLHLPAPGPLTRALRDQDPPGRR